MATKEQNMTHEEYIFGSSDYTRLQAMQHDRDLRRQRIVEYLNASNHPVNFSDIVKYTKWPAASSGNVFSDLKMLIAQGLAKQYGLGLYGRINYDR
jgi:hypothetical protein